MWRGINRARHTEKARTSIGADENCPHEPTTQLPTRLGLLLSQSSRAGEVSAMGNKHPNISPRKRGLGTQHEHQRARLLANHIDGSLCWWCNEPLYRDAALNPDRRSLNADHSHARSKGGTQADRLLHDRCNKSRGDGRRDHLRPALNGTQVDAPLTTRQWF